MGFREVSVVEVREALRAWLEGHGLRTVAERAGVDRKTARRYVAAAQAAGLVRDAGPAAVSDELVGAVVEAVRPVRPNGHHSRRPDRGGMLFAILNSERTKQKRMEIEFPAEPVAFRGMFIRV